MYSTSFSLRLFSVRVHGKPDFKIERIRGVVEREMYAMKQGRFMKKKGTAAFRRKDEDTLKDKNTIRLILNTSSSFSSSKELVIMLSSSSLVLKTLRFSAMENFFVNELHLCVVVSKRKPSRTNDLT